MISVPELIVAMSMPRLVHYGLAAVNREVQRRAVPEHPPAGLRALSAIVRTDARRVSDVADRMRIDLSVASRQVAMLEAAGWVRREPDPDDRRAQRLEATDAGRAALAAARARMIDAYASIFANWSEDDLQALHATLGRLRADFARAGTGPALPAAAGAV